MAASTRPKPKVTVDKNDDNKTNGRSKRTFQVLVGCDWGDGYRPAGSLVDDVPADMVATWCAEGVLVPDGEELPDGVVPVTEQCTRSHSFTTTETAGAEEDD